MPDTGSITRCIRDLEAGARRDEAARDLFERFFGALTRYALIRLRRMRVVCGPADEEDVAERAFTKVYRAIEGGRLKLRGRVDLEKILLVHTRLEAISLRRRGLRSAGQVSDDAMLTRLIDDADGPDSRSLMEEGLRKLFDLLDDEEMRRIALWAWIGYTNDEIAERLGCSRPTVERKLARIRARWAGAAPGIAARPGRRRTS